MYNILSTVLWVLFGFVVAYLKTRTDIIDAAKDKIAEAEIIYKDTVKAGGTKMKWVVDTIYNTIPSPLQIVFTKEMIQSIVQNIFNSIDKYAKTQLDKLLKE